MPIDRPTYQLKFALDLPEEQAPAGLSAEDVAIISEAARKRLDGGEIWAAGAVPAWYENYLRLKYTGWDWRVACYIAWLAMPKPRSPKTQLELAQTVLGLGSDRQLSVWQAKNPAIPEMVQKLRTGLVFEELGEIIAAGVAVAKKEDYKSKGDRELIYKMTGLIGDNTLELKIPGQRLDLSKVPYEQKLEMAGLNTPEERAKFEFDNSLPDWDEVIEGEVTEQMPQLPVQLPLNEEEHESTGSDGI